MYQHLGKVSFHGSVLEVIVFFILICILTCYFSRIDSRGDGALLGVCVSTAHVWGCHACACRLFSAIADEL